MKSGITGWAQVCGLRGRTPLADRAEWDNFYIENFSLWLDVKIALMTRARGVQPEPERRVSRRKRPRLLRLGALALGAARRGLGSGRALGRPVGPVAPSRLGALAVAADRGAHLLEMALLPHLARGFAAAAGVLDA